MRKVARNLAIFAVALSLTAALYGVTRAQPASPSAYESAPQRRAGVPTRLRMKNVDFFIDPEIALRIRTLDGVMRSKTDGPILFDDKRSYVIHVDAAEVGLTGKDLSLLLNKYVFNYSGSPLRGLRITTAGNEIVQRGTLHKVFPMAFEIRARLSVTPDGRIRMSPTRTEILGLHVDRLMKGLGLALDEVIDLKKAKGAAVVGNDIYLQPTMILPPPTIEGTVSSVRVEGDQVIQTFGSPQTAIPLAVSDSRAQNYMMYRGGDLKFGKLLMQDAELQINDLDPEDPFLFELDRYQPQLVAGYSRTLPSGGLVVFMRDRDKIGRTTRTPGFP